jgi:flagellar basal body-associated protein FliL
MPKKDHSEYSWFLIVVLMLVLFASTFLVVSYFKNKHNLQVQEGPKPSLPSGK